MLTETVRARESAPDARAEDAPSGPDRASGGPQGPLRIAFASYRSHPHVGGQGVYVRAATAALAEAGHRVDVISGPPYPELDPRVRLIRLPSLDLFAQDNAFAAFRLRFLTNWPDLAEWSLHNTGAFGEIYAFGARFARWFRDHGHGYDIVHDNQSLARGLLAIQHLAPVISTLHHPITVDRACALEAEPRWLYRQLIRRWHGFVPHQARVAQRLDGLLSVSEAAKNQAVTDFGVDPGHVRVALNGVDHSVFHPDPGVPRDPDMVLTAASADTPLKGLAVLLRAFARVRAARPATRLTVIGRLRDGPAKDVLDAENLADAVRFVSNLSMAEMADQYRRAAIMVSPSLFEGFGLPASEAMACGAPLVVSDGGALPEVVGDAGLITPAGDHEALAAAILRLLNDDAERAARGAQAAARAQHAFNWSTHAAIATRLYRDVIAARSDPMRGGGR